MESKGPVVIPVKDPEVNYLNKSGLPPIHKHLPQVDGFGGGACVLLVSPVKSGKSTLISNMLLNTDFYDAQERFDSTHIISNTIANDVTSRFLKEAFDCHDQYNDNIIDGIVERQKTFDKEDQPEIAVIIDDCLGSIKREGRVNHLASRFRHFNIKLLVISSQNFRAVSPIIRQNATNVIIGSPFPNRKELLKVAEEYGDLFGGPERFIQLYKRATPDRYNFIHMDLQENPPIMYRNFDTIMAIGDRPTDSETAGKNEKKVEEENIDDILKE
tara:strand:- start:558 stop:1373 length:816 start_codon:yes stop_codon:yes gene_type:complete